MVPRSSLCLLVLLVACSDTPARQCLLSTDCQPGYLCADGVCTKILQHDTGPVDLTRAEPRPEATVSPPDGPRPDGQSTCQANHDDKIDRAEMPIRVGASIKYSVGSGLKVDLVGTRVGGRTTWDLTASASDEHPYLAELEPVASWAAADFPGATYMSLLDAGYKTYGVFKATPGALQLVGVISKTAPPDHTKLTYSSPVDTLRFPIVVKDSFKTAADVSGPMSFWPYYAAIHETYLIDVLDVGSLKLPELTLDVVLLRARVEQYPTVNPLLVTTRVTFLWVAECYGIVAQVFADGNPGSALSSVLAKERRRITK